MKRKNKKTEFAILSILATAVYGGMIAEASHPLKRGAGINDLRIKKDETKSISTNLLCHQRY
ncbi:MAG TPA: hypothetical protein DDZ96_02215, partial [Porphyromonadaceae bacterium]|nr:hypothetical protein [Porphyromonadaceae bacterium]